MQALTQVAIANPKFAPCHRLSGVPLCSSSLPLNMQALTQVAGTVALGMAAVGVMGALAIDITDAAGVWGLRMWRAGPMAPGRVAGQERFFCLGRVWGLNVSQPSQANAELQLYGPSLPPFSHPCPTPHPPFTLQCWAQSPQAPPPR